MGQVSSFRMGQDGREHYSQAPCNFARRRRCPDSQAASWETLEARSSECSSITVTLGSSAQIAWGTSKRNFGPTLTAKSRPGVFSAKTCPNNDKLRHCHPERSEGSS